MEFAYKQDLTIKAVEIVRQLVDCGCPIEINYKNFCIMHNEECEKEIKLWEEIFFKNL